MYIYGSHANICADVDREHRVSKGGWIRGLGALGSVFAFSAYLLDADVVQS